MKKQKLTREVKIVNLKEINNKGIIMSVQITINDLAVEKVKEFIEEDIKESGEVVELFLRVFIKGGGCSGFEYGFTLDEEKNEDDFLLEKDGVKVLVDAASAMYLHGAEIKYKSEMMGGRFTIDNPNAKSTCGCGSSFSI